MNTAEKIIFYLFNEYFLKDFIKNNCIKYIYDAKLKKFAKLIMDFYIHYQGIPTEKDFEKYVILEADANEYMIMFVKYKKSYVNENYQFLVEELKKEFIKKNVQRITGEIDYTNIDLKDVVYKLSNLERISDDESGIRTRFVYENLDERAKRVQQAETYSSIPSGFEQFDKYTNGFNKKEYYLFFGRSSVGKTRTLFNFAYNLSEQGYVGLYFSLEMYLEQMERLFDSRISGISSDLIKHGKVDHDYYGDILNMVKDKKPPLMFVECMGDEEVNLNLIRSVIRDFKKQHPLDFVVVDYLGLMYERGYKSETEMWGAVSKGLKKIAKQEDVVMISAVQANRKTMEAEKEGEIVGLEHISQSDLIAHHSDFVAYLKRNKTQLHIMDMFIIKNREGRSGVSLRFLVDFAINKMQDAVDIRSGQEEQNTT